MRPGGIALASAAGIAIIAAAVPARASNTDFFLDQHRSYFERGTEPEAAPAEQPAAPQPRGRRAAPVAAAVEPEPADADQDAAAPVFGHGHAVPGDAQLEQRPLASAIPREIVAYEGPQSPGTIVVSTQEKRLYFVLPDGQAIRYGVGVGRPGFEWSGGQTVTAKREWPDWTPPAAMIKRRPDIPHHMAGGIDNPLGARAMYLGRTEYRIHGSNEPDTIGQAVSSGCIRMTNADVADLYEHVKVGTKVIVQR
jgi:lipoprotein-anchoring transpeptidase ErfK/SrfK